MNGWIKLHRSLRDNPIYQSAELTHLWIECLLSATHKEHKIDFGGEEVCLAPGQFVFGRIEWSKRLKTKPSTLYKRVLKLEKFRIISVQKSSSRSGSVYQIENWNKYQAEEHPSSIQVASREHLSSTNKNDKNKRTKEIRGIGRFSQIDSITEEVLLEVSDELMVNLYFVRKKWESFKDYCQSNGKTYKDYKAALRNAVRKDAEEKDKKKTPGKGISEGIDLSELARSKGYKW